MAPVAVVAGKAVVGGTAAGQAYVVLEAGHWSNRLAEPALGSVVLESVAWFVGD